MNQKTTEKIAKIGGFIVGFAIGLFIMIAIMAGVSG